MYVASHDNLEVNNESSNFEKASTSRARWKQRKKNQKPQKKGLANEVEYDIKHKMNYL